jgi:hypothetical protein
VALLAAALTLPACESLEPTRDDALPLQVAKGIVWVPVVIVALGASLVVEGVLFDVREHSEDAALDSELNRRSDDADRIIH